MVLVRAWLSSRSSKKAIETRRPSRFFVTNRAVHVSGRTLSVGARRWRGDFRGLTAAVETLVRTCRAAGRAGPPENSQTSRPAGRRLGRCHGLGRADPRRRRVGLAWPVAGIVRPRRHLRLGQARLATRRHPRRRGGHAGARHHRRPVQPVGQVEARRSSADRARGRR